MSVAQYVTQQHRLDRAHRLLHCPLLSSSPGLFCGEWTDGRMTDIWTDLGGVIIHDCLHSVKLQPRGCFVVKEASCSCGRRILFNLSVRMKSTRDSVTFCFFQPRVIIFFLSVFSQFAPLPNQHHFIISQKYDNSQQSTVGPRGPTPLQGSRPCCWVCLEVGMTSRRLRSLSSWNQVLPPKNGPEQNKGIM